MDVAPNTARYKKSWQGREVLEIRWCQNSQIFKNFSDFQKNYLGILDFCILGSGGCKIIGILRAFQFDKDICGSRILVPHVCHQHHVQWLLIIYISRRAMVALIKMKYEN